MGSLASILLCFLLCVSIRFLSAQQLSQGSSLFRIQRTLEYPSVLHGWNQYTNFCYLPKTANLSITCSGGNITELTIVGDRSNLPGVTRRVLSANFSIDSFFTTLSTFPTIVNLTLVSLGLWGQLPAKVDRFPSLQNLNLSSNFMYREIPSEISRLTMLKSLDLGGNFFKGSVPDLSGLTDLEELDLGRNGLGPDFPVTGANLVSLVINNNSFKATLPMGLRTLRKLERFDASSNKLFGKIPSFLLSLPSIKYLDLSGNRLTGALPKNLNCGEGLEFVDVSSNKLIGRPPTCLRSNTTSLTVTYSWNCLSSVDSGMQHPNSYCNEQPLAVMMPPAVKNDNHESRNSLGLVLGIVGGIAGGIVLVAVIILVVLRKRTGGDGHVAVTRSVAGKVSVHNSPKFPTKASFMSSDVRLGMLGFRPYRVFEMEELEEATNNFDRSNLIHERSQVQLYKGWIQDGSSVTIRCLRLKQKHSPQVLNQCMDAFSKLQHRHLVSILGHCIDDDKDNNHGTMTVYLVFEHVSNGTLRNHLTEWRRREMLKWPQRVQAVIGIARGIQFLHTVTVPGIYGNDLKIENILLDETLTAKIHNYNLPISLRNKNKACPEFQFNTLEEKDTSSVQNGDKEDIYQLGLILLEVIMGKPATTDTELEATKNQLEKILTDDPIDVREMTDPSIHGTFAYDSLKIVVEVALDCLSKELHQRPSVDDILWNLQYSVQVQDCCASSDALSAQSFG